MRARMAGRNQRFFLGEDSSSVSSRISGSALCVSIIAARRSVDRWVTIGIWPVSVARAADPTSTCGLVSRS